MTPVTAALLLALAVPAAPAPKADKGLPKDLIDLLPEDTAGVVVLDVPRAAKSDLGKAVLKLIAAEQQPDESIQVADFARDAELVLIGQFLIDTGFGDFCFLVRLKDGPASRRHSSPGPRRSGRTRPPKRSASGPSTRSTTRGSPLPEWTTGP
jgi:hypothetical protein